MKKAQKINDMEPEYSFDYKKSKPNRFAPENDVRCVMVALDEDVAKVFDDSAKVNNALRAVISFQDMIYKDKKKRIKMPATITTDKSSI